MEPLFTSSAADLVKVAFKIVRQKFLAIIGIVAIGELISFPFGFGMFTLLLQEGEADALKWGIIIAVYIWKMATSVLVAAAVSICVWKHLRKEAIGAKQLAKSTLCVFPHLLAPMVIVHLGGILGSVLLIVPGVVIYLSTLLAAPMIALGGIRGPLEPLKQSWNAMKGHRVTTLVASLAFGVVQIPIALLLALGGEALTPQLQRVIQPVVSLQSWPKINLAEAWYIAAFAIFVTVLYGALVEDPQSLKQN